MRESELVSESRKEGVRVIERVSELMSQGASGLTREGASELKGGRE